MTANPFVGPLPIPAGKELFGRDEEAEALCDTILGNRIVLMHSPSGAGKTSLLQAKVIPMLSAKLKVLPLVRLAAPEKTVTSGNPFISSAVALLDPDWAATHPETATISALLDHHAPASDGEPHLVIFDQFEEVLTAEGDDRARVEFFRDLGDALRVRNRWAIFAMRDEFVGALDPYLRMLPTQLRVRFRLGFLPYKKARTVAESTAALGGRNFDAESLTDLIDELRTIQASDGTKTLGPFIEPVHLQIICVTLWERAGSGAIVLEADRGSTDVNAALARYYETKVEAAALAVESSDRNRDIREIREWFDDVLITGRGFRGLTTQGPDVPRSQEVVKLLGEAYLVRVDPRGGLGTWIELAHDRLVDPVRQNNAAWFAEKLTPEQRQADLWQSRGRPASLLLDHSGVEKLAKVRGLRDVEKEFLAASKTAVHTLRQKARLWSALVSLVIFILIGAVITAIIFGKQNRKLRDAELKTRNFSIQLGKLNGELKTTNQRLDSFKAAVDQAIRYGYSYERLTQLVSAGLGIANQANNPAVPTTEPARADQALASLQARSGGQPHGVIVQYFASGDAINYDLPRVRSDLRAAGFRVEPEPGKGLATNTVWFGKQMFNRPEAVKIVALALIRAGVPITALQAMKNKDGLLIQVGGWNKAPTERLKVADIVRKPLEQLAIERE